MLKYLWSLLKITWLPSYVWYIAVYCIVYLSVLRTSCNERDSCGTYLWVPNRPAPASYNISHHLAHSPVGTKHCARHAPWHSRCIAGIFTTLCPYCPGCDKVMHMSCLHLGIMPYIAVWHMICMSYICHIFRSAVCHATHFQPTHPPIHIQPVILS